MIWLLMGNSLASTITVSSGSSIQTAIDSANSGDIIEIGTGTYSECLTFGGKSLSLVGVGAVTLNGTGCTATATVSDFETISFSDLTMSNTDGLVIDAGSVTSTVSLDNVIVNNSGYVSQAATSLGGVIYSFGTVNIANSTFSGNTGGLGGVLYMEGGNLDISNSIFSTNSGLKGGVLYAKDGTNITSSNNTYSSNTTVNGGFGGVFSLQYTVSYIDDSSVYENNFSEGNGAVFYVNHNIGVMTPNVLMISNALFENNATNFSSIAAGKGGVFYVYNRSIITVTDTDFIGNEADGGGVAWVVAADDTVTFDNCSFDSNAAHGNAGGAISVRANSSSEPTDLEIMNSSFVDNSADYAYYGGGGAIALGSAISTSQQYGSVSVSGSSFSNNSVSNSSNAHGGAIWIKTSSSDSVTVTTSSFDGNTAFAEGGAIYVSGADQTSISMTTFTDNSATAAASYDRYGGAISIRWSPDVVIHNSFFCGNSVTQYPSKQADGGAVSVQNGTSLDIHNVIFQENDSEGIAGAIYGDAVSGYSIVNNTMVGNSATDTAGLYFINSSGSIVNNIIAYSTGNGSNQWGTSSYGDYYQNTDTGNTNNGNIVDQPMFQAYSQDGNCFNDLLMLDSSSTLVDAGDPSLFDGDGTRSDIGAFGGEGLQDSDNDGYSALIDCDDFDADVYPGAAENESPTACREDADGDGYGAAVPTNPNVSAGTDCDDTDGNIYQGSATNEPSLCAEDSDGDGYGASVPINPNAEAGTDCDDTDVLIRPNTNEYCDGVDNDCDGQIDDNPLDGTTFYLDADQDGYGSMTPTLACSSGQGYTTLSGDCDDLDPYVFPGAALNDSMYLCMADHDQDEWGDANPTNPNITAGTDCDDTQSSISPTGTELPADGIDGDCDGTESCYIDADQDGFGGNSVTTSAALDCMGLMVAPSAGDCDDSDTNAYPGAAENDSTTACMRDADGDGYGSVFAPLGGVGGNDCNDNDPQTYYNAPEIPGDGISQDCDNTEECYVDDDGDQYGSTQIVLSSDVDCTDPGEASNADDCDDTNPSVYPSAEEVPYDGIDNDCDMTTIDDDLDGDGVGQSEGDCNDDDATIYPGAEEIPYDGIDNDCDANTVDDDLDADGFGQTDGDCNDEDGTIYPGATDVPGDSIDQDCDGADAVVDTSDTDTDTGEDTIDGKETEGKTGCGSDSSSAAISWLGLFFLLFRRRRDV